MLLGQRAWKNKWAKFEPVRMVLTASTAVARQLIRSKSSIRKTACLDLTSGPQPPQGTGKHMVRSDLAQPVPYTLGTSKFTSVHMEPFSITWNPSPCKPCILVCTEFTHDLHPLLLGVHVGLPEPETTLTIACDTRATRRSVSVDKFNPFESLERL
jgi:hypothetical protein